MDWFYPILQSHGLAGVVIAALAIAVVFLYRFIIEMMKDRLAERDVLIKALESNTTAILENAKVTDARNVVTQELADAISKQAGTLDVFLQKSEFHQSNMKDALQAQGKTFEAFSESNRVNSGILRDIRDHVEGQRE